MTTTELIRPPTAERPTFGGMIAELIPLVGAVAGYGPPVISLAGPWLLLALMLSAPFAVLLTLLAVMLVAATLLVALTAAIVAMLAAPSRLMRYRRDVRARRAFGTDRAAQLVPVGSTRVAA
jgi:hypothetical protein